MAEISGEMVKEKVANVDTDEPDYLIGADVSCLMNIGGRLSREGKPIKVMHIAEVLMQEENKMSYLQTNTLPFKQRVEQQVNNEIVRKALVKAQETIGANRQRMVDELGNWEEWRDDAKAIRNHVLANLDAYLYQLSEKSPKRRTRFLCRNRRRSH